MDGLAAGVGLDRHALAVVSIAGNSLDVLGALYLTYDLLGGEHGPLRTLTRSVTYGLLFGIGYGIALGPIFGIASGAALGITLGWEYSRASRGKPELGFWGYALASAIRGLGFALGAAYSFGWIFATLFGTLSIAGQMVAYRIGMRPTLDYRPATRPRFTKRQFLGVVNRTVGYMIAGSFSGAIAHERARGLAFGLKAGLAIGGITTIAGACTPLIEWGADNVPERRMGVFGIILLLIGFTLQSVQYWVVVLDVPVH